MCKKLGVTALVVVAAFFVLHKLDLDGYAKVMWNRFHKNVQADIPPEMKIELLRAEIDKLVPKEAEARQAIADQQTQLNKQRKRIDEAKANLEKREASLKSLRETVTKGGTVLTTEGTAIPKEKLEASLARQWDSFKAAKDALKSEDDLLKTQEEGLEVAKAKLSTMQDKRKEMVAKVNKMELDLRKLRLAQAQNNVAVDDSQLSKVMKLADEVDTQIQNQQNALNLQKGVDTDAAVEEALARKEKTDKALKEMDDFFGGSTKVTSKKD